MSGIGIVAIGRNEGERLRVCLESIVKQGAPAVYVDSGSTDHSLEIAETLNVEVVNLDMSIPFCAARARNEGFERLIQLNPELDYVMFVDGDCEVNDTWLQTASQEFEQREDAAVVCGRLRERHPEHSVYNWMCDLEWNTGIGEMEQCGGIAVMRVDRFQAVGGFDPTVKVGEEPELCRRFRAEGWKIFRIDAEMALHDAAMTQFGHFWKRQVRNGYGGMDILTRFALPRYKWITRSARFWGLWTPILVLALAFAVGVNFGWLLGTLTGVGLFMVLPLQCLRIAAGAKKKGYELHLAVKLGFLTVIGKWGQVLGQLRYLKDRALQGEIKLIEYKGPAPARPTA